MSFFLSLAVAVCLTSIGCLLPFWRHRKIPWYVSLLGGFGSGLMNYYFISWYLSTGRMPEPKSGAENQIAFSTFILSVIGVFVGLCVVAYFRGRFQRHNDA